MSECRDAEDLIDFEIGSSALTANVAHDRLAISEASDNLLDSELPVLERKLQNAPPMEDKSANNLKSVDVEDILITIDEEDDEEDDEEVDVEVDVEVVEGVVDDDDGVDGFIDEFSHIDAFNLNESEDDEPNATSSSALSNTEILMELCAGNCLENGASFDYDEAMAILTKLDEILNETLIECDRFLNGPGGEETVEECLMDLDNYLSQLEDRDCCETTSDDDDDNESPLSRNFLYLVSKVAEVPDGDRRPFVRNHRTRSTVAVCRRVDDADNDAAFAASRNGKWRKSATAMTTATGRASGAGAAAVIEEIDWGSVRRVARDLMAERRAHASGTCCTGSVIVERFEDEREESMSSHEDVVAAPASDHCDPRSTRDDCVSNTTWLRSSMRRIRRFRLPSDDDDEEVDDTNTDRVSTPTPITTTPATMDSGNDAPPPPSTLATTIGRTGNVAATSPTPSNVVRPVSAPGRIVTTTTQNRQRHCCHHHHHHHHHHQQQQQQNGSTSSRRSARRRSLSSSVTSVASSVDSTPTSSPTVGQPDNQETSANSRSCDRQRTAADVPEMESPLGQWPHGLSSMLACLGCTLGLFNICRFATLSVHFGANFIFQFCVLSIVVGLPLLTLQSALGQQLGAGVIDMWRISPLFQGVGFSLLLSQALLGLYSIIGVSWMFVYFRDSFITKADRYRWAEPFYYYRNGVKITENATYKLSETIPDYLSGVVLQRHHLANGQAGGTIKFQSAFNLAVVWMIVFVSLSKGLRSYGKVIYVFTLVPVFGTFVLCAKLLGMMPHEFINVIFPETNWSEFFLNSKSWLAAAQEVFLTWGLLGAAVMQLASHNKYKHLLQRDSSLITVITFTILLLVAFLANTCVQILKSYGYTYLPDSFEKINTYVFMRPTKEPLPPSLASVPVRYMYHNSFVVGDRVTRPGMDLSTESGYQVLRFATELVPATFALLGSDNISPFWAVLFYFVLILFGIAQQLAIWHCLITGIMAIRAKVLKSWETTITFFSCACGFVFGLPMTTEYGVYIVYFMDLTVGGSWWLILIVVLQIVAVFMVRGRPYSGDTVVTALFTTPSQSCFATWTPALLSFTWNVVLPVSLMILCITIFKNGNFRELFIWHHAPTTEYWPLWARQVGSMLQLLPILFVPLIAVIQSYRYLSNGPPDILDRIQLLYRPPIGGQPIDEHQVREIAEATIAQSHATAALATAPVEDPPPKYTPPPSYTTATGARLAKLLRQSIRRSMRRLATVLGESSGNNNRVSVRQRQRQTAGERHQQQQEEAQPPPPDYDAVLVEINQSAASQTVVGMDGVDGRSGATPPAMTAADVASILRNSFRRSARRAVNTLLRANLSIDSTMTSLSAENLVAAAAPIGETSLVVESILAGDDDDDGGGGGDGLDDRKSAGNNDLATVIR